MNNTLKMGFVAAITVFTLAIMSAQAGGEAPPIRGGIADPRYIKTKMTVKVSASNNTTARNADEGSATTGDTTTGTTSGEVSTAGIAICDFSGFAQNDVINNAYAGGASLTGVVKPNIHIGFFDARVLNAYFGANEPNPGIAYSNTGSILVSLQNIAVTNFAFSYTCTVKLTVRTFSSVDGSGTALNTYTLEKNLPGTVGPYNVWTNFSQPIDPTVRSVSISGDAARWAIDQVVMQIITDCNNNGIADATDITNGTSQDCNGNGIPDSCDIASGFAKDCNGNGVPDSCDLLAHGSPAPGAVQWRVEDGGNGHWYWSDRVSRTWSNAKIAAELQNAHLATSTSSAENEFLRTVIAQFNLDRPWIGGFQDTSSPDFTEPAGGWRWVTGETWNYTRWASIEPNNQGGGENWLHFGDNSGLWNDLPASSQWTSIMEWETTQALDCNGNGIPDSCDIGSGNSRDVNVNGIPDECEVPANLTLTNDAGACNHAGGSVNVDATLSGVLSPIVSGQIYISWNPANMTLNSITAGDAPFDQLPLHTINQSAGTALLVTSIALGQPPVSVISKIVARMQFTIRGGTCDGSGTDVQFFPDGTLPTTFTDGLGSELVPALVASSGFKVDDTSPVFSNVPAAVSVNADAGEGAFARVALIAPTATDACGAVTQTSSRSDGAGMDAMYAVGTTTVTWSTTDLCGNSSTATTSVTVNPYNTARFQVQYVGVNGGAATRSFVTTMRGSQISLPSTVNGVSIANGAGEFFVTNAPIDSYFCATVEDAASTLNRRVSVTDAGTEWNVVVTLVSGDVINDEVVDVLDWGAYVVLNANADLNMDNSTNASDGDMILANFGQKGDTGCGSNFTDSPEPVTSISIAELVDRGMADLVAADLNNDGWLDMADIELSRR